MRPVRRTFRRVERACIAKEVSMIPRRALAISLALILILPLAPWPALAASGTVSTCDWASFDAVYSAAPVGGAITFACFGTITPPATVAISSNTVLDGNGNAVIFDGADSLRLFDVATGASLELRELTLQRGRAGEGGAVRTAGVLTVVDSIFRGNSAVSTSPLGGAIRGAESSTISITGSTFEDNRAQGDLNADGGALHTQGTLTTLTETVFRRNSAGAPSQVEGGALWIDTTGPVDWRGLVFEENQALSAEGNAYGGAVHFEAVGSPSRLERASFIGNEAVAGPDPVAGLGRDAVGGALYQGWTPALETLRDATFLNNLAQGAPAPPARVGMPWAEP